MTNKSLPERLKELVGEYVESDSTYHMYCNRLRQEQRESLSDSTANMEADLKGLLPNLIPEEEILTLHPEDQAAMRQQNKVVTRQIERIEHYCRGTE